VEITVIFTLLVSYPSVWVWAFFGGGIRARWSDA